MCTYHGILHESLEVKISEPEGGVYMVLAHHLTLLDPSLAPICPHSKVLTVLGKKVVAKTMSKFRSKRVQYCWEIIIGNPFDDCAIQSSPFPLTHPEPFLGAHINAPTPNAHPYMSKKPICKAFSTYDVTPKRKDVHPSNCMDCGWGKGEGV